MRETVFERGIGDPLNSGHVRFKSPSNLLAFAVMAWMT